MASPSLDTAAQTARARWGQSAVRVGGLQDDVDGSLPALVFEPPDVPTLAEMLGWANTERLTVVPRGGGSTLGWGAAPGRVDVALSTACLRAPIDHCPGDLTATVAAGASLAAVNERLGVERQWLALDPPAAERATIGGIIATNDSGPRRFRYGTPRDLIIGVEMALVDGRTAKAGGKVVKNVAGYDLARLVCGSFGSLVVITGATFKLSPLPAASRTVVTTAGSGRQLTDLALVVADAPLTPSAIEIQAPRPTLLIRFETTDAAADRQAVAVQHLCKSRGIDADIVDGDAESSIWRRHDDFVHGAGAALVRLAVLPTQVGDALEHLERVTDKHGLAIVIAGRAALGVLSIGMDGTNGEPPSAEALATAIDEVRRNAWARGGSLVIRRAPAAVKALVDVWGDVGDALPTMRAVKARFDPNRILNPGRGPGGL
jgi:glycolate oxidase FAD binding subunit